VPSSVVGEMAPTTISIKINFSYCGGITEGRRNDERTPIEINQAGMGKREEIPLIPEA
jgi:hypothetical protein